MNRVILLAVCLLFSVQAQAFSICLFGIGWNCDEEPPEAMKKALVIGNSKYPGSPLKNPVNDALDVSVKLKKMGFEVTTLIDADETQMNEAISGMGKTWGGVEIFYYAGHGVSIDDKNYLLPTDQKFRTENQVKFNAVDVAYILEEMKGKKESANRLSVMILDACRDNPLKTAASRSIGNKKGLVRITKTIPQSMVLYSASADQVAFDGEGRNGLFTRHLLHEMDKPDVEIEDMFKAVSRKVEKETLGEQIPERVYTFTGSYQLIKSAQKPKIDPQELMLSKGGMTIDSQPSGALVTLEGFPLGKTPYDLLISPGPYQVKLYKDGYQPAEQQILIKPQTHKKIRVNLKAD